jgi:hypothetical protein
MDRANRVEVPVTVNGRIQRSGDVDWFALPAKEGQRLVMEVFARRLDSPMDSILTLHNSKGQPLAENDDTVDPSESLVTHHADSRLVYTFPTAGPYLLRIADVQGKGGDEYAYRLVIAPERPDFALRITPDTLRLGPGETVMVTVDALRKDGFSAEIRLAVQDLPKGFLASQATIPAGQNQAQFTVTASDDASAGVVAPAVTGTAQIGKDTAVRKACPAETVMQAFAYTYYVPTKEFLLDIVPSAAFTLAARTPPGEALQVPQEGEVQVTIKVIRKEGVRGPVSLSAKPPPGITAKATFIPADKDEATLTIAAGKQAPVGLRQSIIVVGILRAGKETMTRVAPAIPIEVAAARK